MFSGGLDKVSVNTMESHTMRMMHVGLRETRINFTHMLSKRSPIQCNVYCMILWEVQQWSAANLVCVKLCGVHLWFVQFLVCMIGY